LILFVVKTAMDENITGVELAFPLRLFPLFDLGNGLHRDEDLKKVILKLIFRNVAIDVALGRLLLIGKGLNNVPLPAANGVVRFGGS